MIENIISTIQITSGLPIRAGVRPLRPSDRAASHRKGRLRIGMDLALSFFCLRVESAGRRRYCKSKHIDTQGE